jgi:hypothetical protein
MDSRTFEVTPEQLAGLVAMLAGHGFTIDPTQPTGELKTGGWDISYSLAPGEVTIDLVKHPWLEESAFWAKIENVLKPS